jgi:hypothetical protein
LLRDACLLRARRRQAQAGAQILAQIAHGLGVDAVADGFVRNAKPMALGVGTRQCQGNLFGRPALARQMLHDVTQEWGGMQFTQGPGLDAPMLTRRLDGGAGVVADTGVAAQIPADGAGRAAEKAGDFAHAVVLLLEAGQGHSVFRLELAAGSEARRHPLILRHGKCRASVWNSPTFFNGLDEPPYHS